MTTTNGSTAAKRTSERELREALRDQFTAAIAAGKPRTARRLLESWFLWDGFGGSDLLDRIRPRTNTDGETGWMAPPSVPSDRRHGADWWVWRTQQQLDMFRQESRLRHAQNSFAQGLLKNLTNNVIGKGFSYEAKSIGPDGKPVPENKLTSAQKGDQDAVQRVVQRFLRMNNWNGVVNPVSQDAITATRERELFRTQKIDGEAFLRFHGQDDGAMLVRLTDAAQVRDGGNYLPQEGWSFGIQHKMEPYEDVQTYLKMAVFWADVSAKGGLDGGIDKGVWEEVDAADIIHIKGPDTPSNVKRGLGLFLFDLGHALDRAAKLQNNASVGASVRAAIAMTEQWEQATQSQISSMAAALASHQHTNSRGQVENIERIKPGTVRRVPEGWKLGDTPPDNTASYLTGVQGDLQQAGSGVCAPAYWFGDTGNVNYNNAESAAAPAVRDGQTEQEYWKAVFARCVWKAILWAVQCDQLAPGVEDRVIVHVEAPAVLHRNELEKAQEDQIGVQSGWKDRQTCAAERGLDFDQVMANNEEYAQQTGGAGMGLPLPGDDDGGGGLGGGDDPPRSPKPRGDGLTEALLEAVLQEAGFTGIDKHGHKWVNGKQVKRGDKQPVGKAKKGADETQAHPGAAHGSTVRVKGRQRPASGGASRAGAVAAAQQKLAGDVKQMAATPEGKATLAKGRALAAKARDTIAAGVKSALEGLDAESMGGLSLIAGGISKNDKVAVAAGAAQLTSSVFRCVHEEMFELMLSQQTGGPAFAAKIAAKVAGKGVALAESALFKAAVWAWGKLHGGKPAMESRLLESAEQYNDADKKLLAALAKIAAEQLREALAAAGVEDVEIDEAKLAQRIAAGLRE